MTDNTLKFYLSNEAEEKGVELVIPRIGDAGFDIQSMENIVIKPKSQVMVSTGLHVAVPLGYVMIIKDRSGMAGKRRIYTHAGVIDAGYRGEVKIVVSNDGDVDQEIKIKDKIAQALVVPCVVEASEVSTLEDLGETDRGANGFGSTGR